MATKRQEDQVGKLIKEVEALAKRLRTDIEKRAKAGGLLKNLKAAADQLRKRAAAAAAQVEKYVHEIRKELEGGAKPAKQSKSKKRKRPMVPSATPM